MQVKICLVVAEHGLPSEKQQKGCPQLARQNGSIMKCLHINLNAQAKGNASVIKIQGSNQPWNVWPLISVEAKPGKQCWGFLLTFTCKTSVIHTSSRQDDDPLRLLLSTKCRFSDSGISGPAISTAGVARVRTGCCFLLTGGTQLMLLCCLNTWLLAFEVFNLG